MTITTLENDERTSNSKRQLSILIVAICTFAILIAVLLTPTAPGASLTFAGLQLPPTCGSVRTLGIECPGCGLTRSWVSAVHFRLSESFAHHRLGWLVLLYAMLQILRHASLLAKPNWRTIIEPKIGKYLDYGVIVVAALLFLNWIPYLWSEILRPMW